MFIQMMVEAFQEGKNRGFRSQADPEKKFLVVSDTCVCVCVCVGGVAHTGTMSFVLFIIKC